MLPEPLGRRLEQRLQFAGTPRRIGSGDAINPLPRRNRRRHQVERRLAKRDGDDALAEIDRGGDLDGADARLTRVRADHEDDVIGRGNHVDKPSRPVLGSQDVLEIEQNLESIGLESSLQRRGKRLVLP